MSKELVVTNQEVGIMILPEETLEFASRAAKALKRVVSLKTKPVIMNGEQYLEMEDWELLGQFYGYTVRTHHAEAVEIDGVKGAKAEADLVDIRTGEVIGGAEAYCMRDEEHWNTRPKYDWQGEGNNRRRVKVGDEIVPWFQLASMAQTRAGSKAFRNRLAWVVVLAGYKATPAEEMTDGTVSEAVQERRTVDKTAHYCPVHNVNFFKKGRMEGYAHPIEGTDEWCNEAEPSKPKASATTSTSEQHEPEASEVKSGNNLPVEEKEAPETDERLADLVLWINETMEETHFRLSTLKSWLKSKQAFTGLDLGGEVEDIIGRMNQEQQQFLVKELEDRQQMK